MLRFYYSGAVAPNTPQNNPDKSLGGYLSGTPLPNGVLNNLFPEPSAISVQARTPQIAAVFLKNEGTTSVYNLYVGTLSSPTTPSKLEVGCVLIEDQSKPVMELISSTSELPFTVEFHNLSITHEALPAETNGSGFITEEFPAGAILGFWFKLSPLPNKGVFDFEAALAEFKANDYQNGNIEEVTDIPQFVLTYSTEGTTTPPPTDPTDPVELPPTLDFENEIEGGGSANEVSFGARPGDKLEFDTVTGVSNIPFVMGLWLAGEQVASITYASFYEGELFRYTNKATGKVYILEFTAEKLIKLVDSMLYI
jgi:hypothetical protein